MSDSRDSQGWLDYATASANISEFNQPRGWFDKEGRYHESYPAVSNCADVLALPPPVGSTGVKTIACENLESEDIAKVEKHLAKNDNVANIVKDIPIKKSYDPIDRFESLPGKFTLNRLDKKLLQILSYRRPHGTRTEAEFIRDHIDSVPGMERDTYGNRYIRIGDSSVMWSCHTDTVHTDEGFQNVHVSSEYVHLTKKDRTGKGSYRTCLGADDGAGIWLMLKMIERKIPGLYVFHRGEEIGGLGSSWIVKNAGTDFTDGITQVIALDRKGYDSVITRQGGKCCSDEYASALAKVLGGEFKPDPTGLFTDSANYTGIIPECTNLSVGYFRQHGPSEHLNFVFLEKLLEKLCDNKFEDLPIKRDLSDHGYSSYYGGGYGLSPAYAGNKKETTYDYTGSSINDDKWDYDSETNTYHFKRDKKIHEETVMTVGGTEVNYNGYEVDAEWEDDPNNPNIVLDAEYTAITSDNEERKEFSIETERFRLFKTICKNYPRLAADLLEENGFTMQDLIEIDTLSGACLLLETDIDLEEVIAFLTEEEWADNQDEDDEYDTV